MGGATVSGGVAAGGSTIVAMATLYRCPTPTDRLCPCGRVARALRREAIAFDAVAVPLRRARRDEVEALTGQRRVPVLVIDGQAICDSRRILEYLQFRRTATEASRPSGG
jgi:glutathione S-transferase